MTFERLQKAREELNARKDRSAWDKGVTVYALEILDTIEERAEFDGKEPADAATFKDYALNGASEPRKPGDLFAAWLVASWGGSYLIYDYQIARRLCNNTELKRTNEGEKQPNRRENWLDVQGRALYQAYNRLYRVWARLGV